MIEPVLGDRDKINASGISDTDNTTDTMASDIQLALPETCPRKKV